MVLWLGAVQGAMIQFDKFHITPGPLYPDYKVINGIGMIDMDMGKRFIMHLQWLNLKVSKGQKQSILLYYC